MPPSHNNGDDEIVSALGPPGAEGLSQAPFLDNLQGWQWCDDQILTSYNTPQNGPASRPSTKLPRPLNSYMLFLADFRKLHAHSDIKPTTTLGGKAWRELLPETKEYYKRRALELKREHASRYPYTPQPQKGLGHRPHGFRKLFIHQGRKFQSSTSESLSPAIGLLENTEFTFTSSRIQPDFPSHPNQGCQSITTPSPLCLRAFDIAPLQYSPEQHNSALGLSHVPFPSPRTSFLTSPLLPPQAINLDSSPITSPSVPPIYHFRQTPPTPHNVSFTSYTSSPSLTQPTSESYHYPSPLLYFQQLTLNDEHSAYPSTSGFPPPAPMFQYIALPQGQINRPRKSAPR